jgi:hypothetical protein
MARKLSTFGWILHDLGLASVFGGSLFGRLALNRAVALIGSNEERGRVINAAWNGYNILNAAAMATAAATWLTGRSMLSGNEVDAQTHKLVVAKDALFAGAIGTGIANVISGALLAKEGPAATPLISGNRAAPDASPRAKTLVNLINVLGPVNLALTAGIIGLTSVLSMKAAKSSRFGFISSFLP